MDGEAQQIVDAWTQEWKKRGTSHGLADRQSSDRPVSTKTKVKGAPWTESKMTDPEPGKAPSFASLSNELRALWFGENQSDDLDTCESAWHILSQWVDVHYPGGHLWMSPGHSGLRLIRRQLPWPPREPRPYRYAQMSEDLMPILRANDPMHRYEVFQQGQPISWYGYHDARVSFLSHLRRVPVLIEGVQDKVLHDSINEYIPYRNGFYRSHVTVPKNWEQIGLVLCKESEPGESWRYPNTPNERFETWLDECEMRLLHEHNWSVDIHERMLFTERGTPGDDPLRQWHEHLCEMLERIERTILSCRQSHKPVPPIFLALREAFRSLTHHPIGLWHKSINKERGHGESLSEVDDLFGPDEDLILSFHNDDSGFEYTRKGALTSYQKHQCWPERSTSIHARTRVATTRLALKLPRQHLIGIWGDAIHYANYDPMQHGWEPDTGRIGCYRQKTPHLFSTPRPRPKNLADLDTIRKQAEREEKQ